MGMNGVAVSAMMAAIIGVMMLISFDTLSVHQHSW